MYLLAVVIALWGAGNLMAGDYGEGVVGITAAAILAAGQYFWDALGGDGVWQRLKVPLAVGVMIGGLGVVALMILEEVEIGAQAYVELQSAVEQFPSLRGDVARALGDGKVSVVEYHAFEQAYHEAAKRRALEMLGTPR
ncbi:MAG: hypothetical protein PVF93_00430 [Chromatiaceae bacterium]|jgi:hypothetical protein